MSFDKPSNNEDLPFLVNAPTDKICQFEFKPSTIDTGKNDKKWSCYTLKVRNVVDPKGTEIIGVGEIPFWAMESFYSVFESRADEKAWVIAQFEVTKKGDERTAEFMLEDE